MNLPLKNWSFRNKIERSAIYRQALCLPVLAFLCVNVSAQNLVPNPSFEEYTDCPTTGGVDGIELSSPWYSVQNSSVDYYNACSTIFSVPSRPQGDYQEALTGDAYAAIWCYSPTVGNVREYLQTPLQSSLLTGRKYYFEFYVNACNLSQTAVNNLGIHFSDIPISTSGSEYLLNVPSYLSKFNNPVIKDTLNWIKIDGIFHATGGESYITIGNFEDDVNTLSEEMPNGLPGFPAAYYFIENVSVEEITAPFWEYRDTTIHLGDSVLIGPVITGLDIDWYTAEMNFIKNAPGIYVKPITSRNYIAKETFNGIETSHFVHVTVIDDSGIEENELDHIYIAPNPSKGEFILSGYSGHDPLELQVIDINGKVIFIRTENLLDPVKLDIDNGIYFVSVVNPITNESSIEKLIIQR